MISFTLCSKLFWGAQENFWPLRQDKQKQQNLTSHSSKWKHSPAFRNLWGLDLERLVDQDFMGQCHVGDPFGRLHQLLHRDEPGGAGCETHKQRMMEGSILKWKYICVQCKQARDE